MEEGPPEGGANWVLYVVSLVLVLAGGAFAGLTIALMGQDSIYLQVIAQDREEPQRKNAKRVYDLLQKGKHWVLVTLLLSNVIVNETLPVVLDRCLGGGIAAVFGSTLLIGMLFPTILSHLRPIISFKMVGLPDHVLTIANQSSLERSFLSLSA